MAKIFRKIRQQLLSQKKIRQYLAYAIGEIILVVIGILIALQINTYNQTKQREKLEKVVLQQVKFELLEIYEDVWRDMENLKLGNQAHYTISKALYHNAHYNKELCFDFHWLQVDEYVYPTTAAYSKLKEEGLDMVKNDSIRTYLQGLYEGYFPRLLKNNTFTPDISTTYNSYYLNSFKPNTDFTLIYNHEFPVDTIGKRIYNNVSYNYPILGDTPEMHYTVGYVPLDFKALQKDPKFQMLLTQTKNYRANKLRLYRNVKSIIKNVVPLIDKVIEED